VHNHRYLETKRAVLGHRIEKLELTDLDLTGLDLTGLGRIEPKGAGPDLAGRSAGRNGRADGSRNVEPRPTMSPVVNEDEGACA
jgi:hypothetical protein